MREGEKEFRRELQTVPMCDPITDALDMATCQGLGGLGARIASEVSERLYDLLFRV